MAREFGRALQEKTPPCYSGWLGNTYIKKGERAESEGVVAYPTYWKPHPKTTLFSWVAVAGVALAMFKARGTK